MKTNRLLLIVSLFALGLTSCVKDEVYIDNTVTAESPIMLNEVFSRGEAPNYDWVEIYNSSNEPVNIGGYKIYDGGGQTGAKPKKLIPDGTIIPAKGFYAIATEGSGDASDFGLSSGGDLVILENNLGEVIDDVEIPAMPDPATSYGRMPDGAENWQILTTITRGAANDDSPAPVIKINELYSRGGDTNPDWIELYNTSTSEVDISGFKIYDNGGQAGTKQKMTFAAGTKIPANGFFVIVVDDPATANPTGSDFGLGSGGEKVWLENSEGKAIDSVAFPALTPLQSYGRFADGTENWQILEVITQGAANDNSTPSPIVINEIFSRGADPDFDWIEIYNNSSSPVDISGYKIYDGGGQSGSKPKMEFPASTSIPANGFIVIVVDDATSDFPDGSSFGLGSGGEQIWLENASGTVINTVTFPALTETQSYGRIADGTYNWQILNTITKGTANSLKK
jgi:hypothetical protein